VTGKKIWFDRGTLLLEGVTDAETSLLPGLLWDPRTGLHRAPAFQFRRLQGALGLRSHPRERIEPARFASLALRPYQGMALAAWEEHDRRALVVLPTGAGKTRLGMAAIASVGEPALCVAPTRALVYQWVRALEEAYSGEVGVLADGARRVRPITVATFESAYRHMHRLGGTFSMLVIDEVHHFGGGQRDELLEMCAASMRLGLTATPPGPEALARLEELVGPVAYELRPDDLAGTFLAHYDLIPIRLQLDPVERAAYEQEMRAFRRSARAFLRLSPRGQWRDLVQHLRQDASGRRALAGFRKAREIVAFPEAKRHAVSELLARHRGARILVFTPDNRTAYEVARAHLLMPITCDIGRKERELALSRFRNGELKALVSSRVLNEGLDVPDADVGIVVGGRLGPREHVQRVGRLLRPGPNKRARIYELVIEGTSEMLHARRRRAALRAC
jgi:superfamily II DNA or RNA helicase